MINNGESTTDKNTLINNITENIYDRISQRVTNKKKLLKKRRCDIVAPERETLFSHICNNKRYPKKNDYLLTPYIADEIIKGLEFTNLLELVWGTSEERLSILEKLFFSGLDYLWYSNSDLIKRLYMNYLPFARSCAFIDEKKEHGNIEGLIDSGHEYLDYDMYNDNRLYARQRIFRLCREEFTTQHEIFFIEKGTSKIDREIRNFFEVILLKILINMEQKDKRGENVYHLIRGIILDSCMSWLTYMDYIENKHISSVQNNSIQETFQKGMEYVDSIISSQKILEIIL